MTKCKNCGAKNAKYGGQCGACQTYSYKHGEPRKLYSFNCKGCGEHTVRVGKSYSYCSTECYKKTHEPKWKIKTCRVCTENFACRESSDYRTYCSKECYDEKHEATKKRKETIRKLPPEQLVKHIENLIEADG